VSGIKTRNSDMRSAAGSSACRFALSACIASKTGSLSKHANATLNFQREKIMTQIFDRTGALPGGGICSMNSGTAILNS
jgi:hypothetical protein